MSRLPVVLVVVSATLVAILGAFSPVADAISVPFMVGWSWAEAGRAPSRLLEVPVVFWAAAAAYAWIVAKRGSMRLPNTLALAVIAVIVVGLSRGLVAMRADAASAALATVYVVYVRVVTLAELAAVAGLGAYAVRTREALLYPVSASAVLTLGEVTGARDLMATAALVVGATIPFVAGRWLPRIPGRVPWGTLALAAIFAVAITARMLLTVNFLRAHGLDFPSASDDGPSYDDFGWLLASGRGAEVPRTHFYYNAYILFLGLIYGIVGHSFLVVGAVQAGLGALTAWATYWVARPLGGRAVALVAALAVALNGLLIWLAAGIGTEALAVPLLAVAVVLLVRGTHGARPWTRVMLTAVAGLLLGLAAITRDVMLGLPLFLLPWATWSTWRAKLGPAVVALTASALLVGALAVWLPFALYRERFTFTGEYLAPVAYSLGHEELERLGVGLRYGIGPSLAAVAARPGDVAAAFAHEMWTKWDRLLFSTSYGSFDPTFLVEESTYARIAEVYFLAFVIGGLWLLAARPRGAIETRVLLFLLPVYAILAHVILFHANAATRYRAPYDPVFAIAFALAAVAIGRAALAELRPAEEPRGNVQRASRTS